MAFFSLDVTADDQGIRPDQARPFFRAVNQSSSNPTPPERFGHDQPYDLGSVS